MIRVAAALLAPILGPLPASGIAESTLRFIPQSDLRSLGRSAINPLLPPFALCNPM